MKLRDVIAVLVQVLAAVVAGVVIGWVARDAQVRPVEPAVWVDVEPSPTPTPTPTRTVPASLVEALGGMTPEKVSPELARALAEEPGQADRDWSVCDFYVGDTSYVVCPDGYFLSS